MRTLIFSVFLLLAGCAGGRHEPAQTSTPPVAPLPINAPQSTVVAATPAIPPSASAASSSANQSAPGAKTPAKIIAPPAPARQGQKKDSATASVSKQETAPTLDVKSLEDKLKETKAIGVFTKLSLKNQVDDLLDRFRAFHHGQRPPTLAELRQPYDLLLMKVLSLLQDDDAPLAHEISASREALWGILSDPAKFATTVGAAS